jgi:hypothetical protein
MRIFGHILFRHKIMSTLTYYETPEVPKKFQLSLINSQNLDNLENSTQNN